MASRSDEVRRLARLRAASVAVTALLWALAARADAQDTNYWSIQYGPVGQLVGGQLIGGGPDLSATFYNPGALVLRNESSYLLSTESVQWELVSTEAQPGLNVLDSSSSTLGAAPSLLAGALPRWLGDDTSLAWSFLTRQKFHVRLGQRVTDPLAQPGALSAAETYVDQRLTESWTGLTLSRRLSESVGLGLTWYGVYRGQRTRSELTFQAVGPDAGSIAVLGVTDFDYAHYRTLAKLGLAWQTAQWNAGISVTTPSLGAFGSGKAGYTLSVTGNDRNGDGQPDPPTLDTGSAEDLATDYRSSWALGMGASKRVGRTRLYGSAEWYAAVDRFQVIAIPDASTESGRLTQELGSVLNGGFGFEHLVNERVSVYGAFHTDFTASVGDPDVNVAVSDWDLYHVSGGVSFRLRDNQFTLGASWATGGKKRPLDSAVPPDAVPNAGLGADVQINYSKFTFLLGFVFGT
jgi:hypothetical protein